MKDCVDASIHHRTDNFIYAAYAITKNGSPEEKALIALLNATGLKPISRVKARAEIVSHIRAASRYSR